MATTSKRLIEIEEAYGRMTGLHASLVHGLSEDDLVNMMTAQGSIHPERFVAMAILLHEEGDIYSDRDDTVASAAAHAESAPALSGGLGAVGHVAA